jgi:dTDP-4-dehydrorhamnose 3,5-epimerase
MRVTPLAIDGAFLIEPEPLTDARGFFARVFCADELRSHGLDTAVVQCSVSFNERRGTLRGMHYQIAPHEETKIVRCTAGALYDVILDLRSSSRTFGRWLATELTAENRAMVYVPRGCAHGFQTLVDHTEVFYQMSAAFASESARRVRFDDPAFGIAWPLDAPIVSREDANALPCSAGALSGEG